jgi:bifunctional non-homologous end joining protein LigD
MTGLRSPRRRRPLAGLSPGPLPPAPVPMLCTLIAEAFDHPDWVFEPKFDGLRVLVRYDGRELSLISRNQKAQNVPFPDVVAALSRNLKRPCVVDGEVVCFDDRGRTSFRALQQRFHLADLREIALRMARHPAYVYLFDLLYFDRYDVTSLPLRTRKALLRKAVRWTDRVRWTEFEAGKGRRLWQTACMNGEEGVVGKLLASPYFPGRSPWWVKVKCVGRQEFVIGGFTDPQRSRIGLGALLVGYYDGVRRLTYAGKVGTGYTAEALRDLRERLGKLEQEHSPFAAGSPRRTAGVHWVKPALVAEVAYAEWTQHGLLRQPRFEGLRPDKRPAECRRERPTSVTV